MIYLIFAVAVLIVVSPWLSRQLKKIVWGSYSKFTNSDLIGVLSELDEKYFKELIDLYKAHFGPGAARYARYTFRKWKTGKVRPSRNTFQRFYRSLPTAMSFDLKCEVVRKLREVYCPKDSLVLEVSTDDWRSTLGPLIISMLEKSRTTELPKKLKDRISWLAEEEAQLAERIIAESNTKQSEIMMGLLDQEFRNIEDLLDKMDGRGKVSHTLNFPIGTIKLSIKQQK